MDINQRILSDITVFMKYAKYLPEKNRRETWTELVDRNKNMHIEKFPYLVDEIEEAYKFVYDKKVLPSMRSLQFAGKPIEINPTRLFNCCALPVDDYRAFSEIMFLLLGGTGVGFSVQKHHVEKLPEIRKPRIDRHRRFLVSDSIEGWADAINVLMKSYFFGGTTINFDCSDIRPKGARLITAGGKAPGPQPLKDCIFKIQGILDAKNDGEQLTTVEVHDIACHLADAVLVGGQRRAALISLFSADDVEMISCKSGNWWELNPQRGRANNSAVLLRNKITKDFFLELWKRIELSNAGEPGIYFSYDKDWLVNPCCFAGKTPLLTENGYEPIENLVGDCKLINKNGDIVDGKVWSNGVKDVIRLKFMSGVEIVCTPDHRFMLIDGSEEVAKNLQGKLVKTIHKSLDYDVVTDIFDEKSIEVFDFSLNDDAHWGVVGNGIIAHNCEIALRPFQMCNLTEVNVSNVVDQRDLNERVTAAAFIGTLQASYTDFHYLRPIWQRTTEKDALIGVSMTGIASNVVTDLNLTIAAEAVKLENVRVANLIGINSAARTTCIKPAGTTSLTLGTASGIHAWHDEYYIRRIRVGKNEAIYNYLVSFHPELVEDEFFRPHDTAVISIPQKAPDNSITRSEDVFNLLERIKRFSIEWIKPGHLNGQNTHNVSATVSIKPDEWDSVGEWMWENRNHYSGLSVLPFDNGSYTQAPFQTIDKETYEKMVQTLTDIDLTNVLEFDDNTDLQGEAACAGGQCSI